MITKTAITEIKQKYYEVFLKNVYPYLKNIFKLN